LIQTYPKINLSALEAVVGSPGAHDVYINANDEPYIRYCAKGFRPYVDLRLLYREQIDLSAQNLFRSIGVLGNCEVRVNKIKSIPPGYAVVAIDGGYNQIVGLYEYEDCEYCTRTYKQNDEFCRGCGAKVRRIR